jgi:chromosome segregation ATPase
MDTGAHIPTYLLCEDLAKEGHVADLFPHDERGSRVLVGAAEQLVVVQSSQSAFDTEPASGLAQVLARPEALPLAKGAYDLVLVTSVSGLNAPDELEVLVRAARSLLRPAGVVAVAVKNPGAEGLSSPGGSRPPDLLDFERAMRRHFPHVTLYAQQPLHGAVLSPLGRRAGSAAPILDDRLLPEGGEVSTHFVALCSPRYHKLDDATIARLPFRDLAEQVRDRVDKLEGTLAVLREESDSRGRQIDSLAAELEQSRSRIAEADEQQRSADGLRARINELDRTIARRDKLLAEAEQARQEAESSADKIEEQLHEARREQRQAERRAADAEREQELARADREEAEKERLDRVDELHRARAEVKSKQRELDDALEQLAGLESELDSLRKEAARGRRDLVTARERARQLELAVTELEGIKTDTSAQEAELQRIREHAAAEREQLERRADEEHRQLLEAIAAREEAIRGARATEIEAQESQASITADKSRAESIADDLGRQVREREAELERQAHAVAMLTNRAEEAERKAAAIEEVDTELRTALAKAEATIGERDQELDAAARSNTAAVEELRSQLESAHAEVERLNAEGERLSDEIERLRPNASSADSARRRALAAEARIAELESDEQQSDARHAEVLARLKLDEERIAELEATEAELRNEIKASAERTQQAEIKTAQLAEVERELRAHLGDTKGRKQDAEKRAAELEGETAELRREIEEETQRREQMETDFSKAMAALAESEEDEEVDERHAEERIRAMKSELRRLRAENETELLRVREDLETELRQINTELEARQGEIWELTEEVVRLRAQAAASAASPTAEGSDETFQRTLAEQESRIAALTEEREVLKQLCEQRTRSLEVRKKNLKILAELFKRERRERVISEPPAPAAGWGEEQPRVSLVTTDLDIGKLITEAGGDIDDDLFEEEIELDDELFDEDGTLAADDDETTDEDG